MNQINRAIVLAGISHISTVVVGLVWILFLANNNKIDAGNFVAISVEESMLIILFPWIVTAVALFSTVMAHPNRYRHNQNAQSTVIWRWRSYSWGAAVIMIIFVVLSFETTGWIYWPTLIFSAITALLNR